MKVIGVVGKNGSGKDEVLKYLRERYNVPFLSSGDIVREIAAKEGLELTRENLKSISEKYFVKFGKGCFIRLISDRIREKGWQLAGITGIRSPDDVQILRDSFGKNFILVHVYVTDPKVRFERMVRRGEARDPLSYEQFLKQEKAEEELFHISEATARADYTLSNNGSLSDLQNEIEKLLQRENLIE